VKNASNEYGGGMIIFKRKLEIHPFLENAKKIKAKALKDIYPYRLTLWGVGLAYRYPNRSLTWVQKKKLRILKRGFTFVICS
jgi:hypothetical protein